MVIEYTIHQYHKHDGDHAVALSGDAAASMARAMRAEGVLSLGHHAGIGITVTKIDDSQD